VVFLPKCVSSCPFNSYPNIDNTCLISNCYSRIVDNNKTTNLCEMIGDSKTCMAMSKFGRCVEECMTFTEKNEEKNNTCEVVECKACVNIFLLLLFYLL
jgi:hypothetical protein